MRHFIIGSLAGAAATVVADGILLAVAARSWHTVHGTWPWDYFPSFERPLGGKR